jgi:hypothetical protein
MNIATLIVEGQDNSLQSFRSAFDLTADSTWKKGDPLRKSGVHSSSGFITTLGDVSSPRELIVLVNNFLRTCKDRDVHFQDKQGLRATLSIGVTVGDSVQYAATVDFTAADLVLIGELGIDLAVSAYPTSDEANSPP